MRIPPMSKIPHKTGMSRKEKNASEGFNLCFKLVSILIYWGSFWKQDSHILSNVVTILILCVFLRQWPHLVVWMTCCLQSNKISISAEKSCSFVNSIPLWRYNRKTATCSAFFLCEMRCGSFLLCQQMHLFWARVTDTDCTYIHLSNQVTESNQVSQAIRDYMHISNLLTGNPCKCSRQVTL